MEGLGWGFEEEEEEEGEGSPNEERQTSFRFLPPLLVKRPILSVGWNLSDFSPRLSPSGACRMSLSSSLPFVSGFLLWCSLALSAAAWLLWDVIFVWRSRLALVLDVKVGARKRCLCLL